MGKVVAGITVSVDGYITGPDDGPGCGLGIGGERLHYWVFGGPWSYDSSGRGEPTGTDKEWLEEVMGANGARRADAGDPLTVGAARDLREEAAMADGRSARAWKGARPLPTCRPRRHPRGAP